MSINDMALAQDGNLYLTVMYTADAVVYGWLGFDPATGKTRFHFPWRAKKLESVNAADPLVVGDRVLITESYGPGSALLRVEPDGYEHKFYAPGLGLVLEVNPETGERVELISVAAR